MKLSTFILSGLIGFSSSSVGAMELTSAGLTTLEADSEIEAKVQADRQRVAKQNRELVAVPANREDLFQSKDGQMRFRRVSPPDIVAMRAEKVAAEALRISQSETFRDSFAVPEHAFENINLHATVYDDVYSEIVLTYEQTRYTIWTNVNFKYLSAIGNFSTDEVQYSYFGFTESVLRSEEMERTTMAKQFGSEYSSRWKRPPVPFSSAEPEYILITPDDGKVSDAVYRQLDDLFAHYLANAEAFRVAYENAIELEAARKRYEAAHPAPVQDIVLNYSIVSEAPEGAGE